MIGFVIFFFFFQAEDGIRDYKVTGVQTCALPISGGDSKGGGAIYAAALQRRPRQHARSPTHRTCERPVPTSSGRRRLVHIAMGAAAGRRGCRTRWGSNTLPSRSSA